MVALEFQASDFAAPALPQRFAGALRVLFVMLTSGILVLAALTIRDASGWGVAADDLWRFSVFAFAAAVIWEPIATLFPRGARAGSGRETGVAVAAFAVTYATYLVFSFAPFWLAKTEPLIGIRVFGLLAATACLVLAISALPRWPGTFGQPLRRGAQVLMLGFFWMSFAICDLDHLYGPHRPDRFFGISVLVLVAALLLRFAASFVRTMKVILARTTATHRDGCAAAS